MPPLPGEVREPAPPLGRSLPGSILSSLACLPPPCYTISTARSSYSSENNKTEEEPNPATATYMGDNNKAQGRSTQSAVKWKRLSFLWTPTDSQAKIQCTCRAKHWVSSDFLISYEGLESVLSLFHDNHYGFQPLALELFQGVSQKKVAHRISVALSGDQIFWVKVSQGNPMAQSGLYWPKQSNLEDPKWSKTFWSPGNSPRNSFLWNFFLGHCPTPYWRYMYQHK